MIVSAFIYFTGGVASYFSSLYVLPIVAASVVRFRRGGLIVASASALLYVAVVLTQFLTAAGILNESWLSAGRVVLPTAATAQYTVAINLFGFFAVALLSGSLAERVRSAGARLEQASTEIADLQALNQHVIDSLPSGLATTDRQQRILTFNLGAESITGMPFAAVVGRHVSEVLQLPKFLADSLAHGHVPAAPGRRFEFKFQRGDDRGEIDLGLGVAHLQTPGGRAGYLITFQDVTDIKKLERDARMQQRLAAVGEMAAGIAHEIRNPLASMSGSIQILRQELPLSAEQEQLMDIVLRESERLNSYDPVVSGLRAPAAVRDRPLRRAPRPQRHGPAAAQQLRDPRRSRSSTSSCRRPSCGSKQTRTRSSRSSGTWPPTASARCPTAAVSSWSASSSRRRTAW